MLAAEPEGKNFGRVFAKIFADVRSRAAVSQHGAHPKYFEGIEARDHPVSYFMTDGVDHRFAVPIGFKVTDPLYFVISQYPFFFPVMDFNISDCLPEECDRNPAILTDKGVETGKALSPAGIDKPDGRAFFIGDVIALYGPGPWVIGMM